MADESFSKQDWRAQLALAEAAAIMLQTPESPHDGRWFETVSAQTGPVLHDTYNGLLAFVVPGHDLYSAHQGVARDQLGGVRAGAVGRLTATIDLSTPSAPHFAVTVSSLLNGVARTVNLAAFGPFHSAFANLSFAEKAIVFQAMEGNGAFKALARVLPGFVSMFVQAEMGVGRGGKN
jgi:hypothetical protein